LAQAVGKSIVRRERVIIERPRLMKKLDESTARTILLLAPAGYGKTTLARQWRATLQHAVWVTLTPAHRDVTVIARDLAESLEEAGDEGFRDFIEQYIRARPNPQGDAALIGRVLAEAIGRTKTEWVILDDYHDLADVEEAHLLVETLLEKTKCRFMVASRTRPPWATARRAIYGELTDFSRLDLAFTDEETHAVVGTRGRNVAAIVDATEGWPAAVAFTAAGSESLKRPDHLPASSIHRYLAEEYLASLSAAGRACLMQLALLPEDVTPLAALERQDRQQIELMLDPDQTLHRLLRDLILDRQALTPVQLDVAREAVAKALTRNLWMRAFEIIHHFSLTDLAAPAIQAAFGPLVQEGRLWTLKEFVERLPTDTSLQALTALVRAEIARANGDYAAVLDAVDHARAAISDDHPLSSRLAALEGEGSFWRLDESASREAAARARRLARSEYDHDLALFLSYRCSIYLDEQEPSKAMMDGLRRASGRSDTARLRYAAAKLGLHRILGTDIDVLTTIDEGTAALAHSKDPNAKSAFSHIAAYALALRAEYSRALELASTGTEIADTFAVTFARPQMWWLVAVARMGLRDYRPCAQLLEKLEHAVAERPYPLHQVNARLLRARYLIATGRPSEALAHVSAPLPEPVFRAIKSEYLGVAALTSALIGNRRDALRLSTDAEKISRGIEGLLFAASARAICDVERGSPSALHNLIELANRLSCWDPVLVALRASRELTHAARNQPELTGLLQMLCTRSEDHHLAHALGVSVARRRPSVTVLSPREKEVLGLLEAGLRNHEIAEALFISEATVKVHIRHIFEKLQVRTRAQAVARAHLLEG
jgi:LuxR family maltose regulon positive regulatory protein